MTTFIRAAALALAAVLALLAAPAGAQDAPVYIHCGTLLDVPGERPKTERTVVVRDGVIQRIEQGYSEPTGPDATVIDLRGAFVMPGLIDCHTHIAGEMSPTRRVDMVTMTEADHALRATVYAERTLEAGFTTIRNVGSMGDVAFALRDAIDEGTVPGPRVLVAGRAITPTGGHGDRTHGYIDEVFEVPTAFQGVADGVDECRKAVRAQVKRGADVIKLTATGGVLSETDAGTDQQFFDDELEAIVETAHALGRKVAAHAHGTDGVNAALRAGVDSIEHGSYLDDSSIELFKHTGAYLVPTVLAGVTVAEIAENHPEYFVPAVRKKALAVGPVMQGMFERAHKAGVKIAFGTDSGVSRHGENAREFRLMVDAGMSPMDALVSATVNAADLCGLSDRIGTIEPGKAADIVATGGSPLENVDELLDVDFVMKGGAVYKNE